MRSFGPTVLVGCMIAAMASANGLARTPPTKPQKLPEEKTVQEDTIEFSNGDLLTGKVVSISGDTMRFNGKVISGTSTVPLSGVRKIYFPETEEYEAGEQDQVVFPNGDRLSLDVGNLSDKTLQAHTLSGEAVALDRAKIEGLVFKKAPMKLLEQDFEDEENLRFSAVAGQWVIEEGMYWQKESNSSFRSAIR